MLFVEVGTVVYPVDESSFINFPVTAVVRPTVHTAFT